ncbi:spore coat U domain-containing protein [Oxalobacter vibrioformis]|uniref:Spore coat U domain-containing protein n=1 Tax=Oxalobacter vibrioformis TaxID=933080 RepID=A0A9E9LSU8_9BURK|nr:spore coat U domain-containing protein [Oxalobacter vibrioformis]WAW09005.1 spore coat U domain-containing protein [Oxalobacter vibrioformis]
MSSSPSGCPFGVQATIQNGCLVSPSGGTVPFGQIDFGSHPSLSSATYTTSLVSNTSYTLNCTPNMTISMSLDGGQHYGSGRRVQLSSGVTLPYSLYSDAAFQNPILVNQGMNFTITGTGNNITLPVYGRIVLPGNAPAGTYTDMVAVTLTW